MPDSVASIGISAFEGCSKLVSVVLPKGITEIGGYAFYGCKNLWHVLYKGTEADWEDISISHGNTRLKNAPRHYECVGNELEPRYILEPTCTEKGALSVTCSVCFDRCSGIQVEAMGHHFLNGVCEQCAEPDLEKLDVNGDGMINARDARALLRCIAGLAEESAADLNGDGKVDARDARALLRYIAALEKDP